MISSSIFICRGPYCNYILLCVFRTWHTVLIENHIYRSIVLSWSHLYISRKLASVTEKSETIEFGWGHPERESLVFIACHPSPKFNYANIEVCYGGCHSTLFLHLRVIWYRTHVAVDYATIIISHCSKLYRPRSCRSILSISMVCNSWWLDNYSVNTVLVCQ